jgi:MerR family transcriptional regulator, light-induced transcriptional regulator
MSVQAEIPDDGHLRIGELSRRVGVSTELLRAWQRRYGLLAPMRTPGGFRLYSEADEMRVRRMLAHLDAGVSAAEAARLVLAERQARPAVATAPAAPVAMPALGESTQRMLVALDAFDDAGAHAALDELLSSFAVETVLRDAVLPYLHELGERWERGEVSVGQEHFASSLLRGRLLGLARGWGNGGSPLALLACVPGDQHDLGLICFGLCLRRHGWRVAYLGPDTPIDSLIETARELGPALVVLTATTAELAEPARQGLAEVAQAAPLALAGAGVTTTLAADVGATYLEHDPVTAAALVARGLPRP